MPAAPPGIAVLIAGFVSAVATGALFLARRRRLGSTEEARRFRAALKSGTAPPDADKDRWRHVLDENVRWTQRFRVLIGTVATLTIALAMINAALFPGSRLVAAVLAAVFVVVAVATERLARHTLRQARHLAVDLPAAAT